MDIELKIEKLVFGGDGLGFVNGKACFVEGALPGETVFARVLSEKKNYSKAKLLRVMEPSPHRIPPPCPYIEQCGGCQYQHLTYAEEVRWKEAQVREEFRKLSEFDPALIAPIRYTNKDYGYRTHVTLHRTTLKQEKAQRLAFIAKDNQTPVLVDRCLLADERLQSVFPGRYFLNEREKGRSFRITGAGEIVSSESETLYETSVGGKNLRASSVGFFQANAGVTALIGQQLRDWVISTKPECFIDLYAGVGTFSVLAAAGIDEVYGFEENRHSLNCMAHNAGTEKIALKGTFEGRVEETFPKFIGLYNRRGTACRAPTTLVFMDPPRQGLEKRLAEFFTREPVGENLVYLSCDLAILVRDLKLILSNQKWVVQEVVPFDMFPRTKHIEVLVRLSAS